MKADRLEYEGFRQILRPGNSGPQRASILFTAIMAREKPICWRPFGCSPAGGSFRGARDGEMKGFAADKAALRLEFTAEDRAQEAAITIQKRRAASIGGIPQPSPSRLGRPVLRRGVFAGPFVPHQGRAGGTAAVSGRGLLPAAPGIYRVPVRVFPDPGPAQRPAQERAADRRPAGGAAGCLG